jgi:hypothetical protein
MGVVSPLSPRQQFAQRIQKQKQNKIQIQRVDRQAEGLQVISPTHSILSPESPFHLEKQYSHLSHSTSSNPSPKQQSFSDLRDGTEKEVVSPVSPERWSGATCLNDGDAATHELAKGKRKGRDEQVTIAVVTPVETPTGLTPSDDFKTWETWAQR